MSFAGNPAERPTARRPMASMLNKRRHPCLASHSVVSSMDRHLAREEHLLLRRKRRGWRKSGSDVPGRRRICTTMTKRMAPVKHCEPSGGPRASVFMDAVRRDLAGAYPVERPVPPARLSCWCRSCDWPTMRASKATRTPTSGRRLPWTTVVSMPWRPCRRLYTAWRHRRKHARPSRQQKIMPNWFPPSWVWSGTGGSRATCATPKARPTANPRGASRSSARGPAAARPWCSKAAAT